jgi:hypothetical protein
MPRTVDLIDRGRSHSQDELIAARDNYVAKVRRGFGWLAAFAPRLTILVADTDTKLQLDYRSRKAGTPAPAADARPDIGCHSSALYRWFTREYGMDGFVVGAHFSILSMRKRALILHLTLGLLTENRIDIARILKMMVSKSGWQFLFNRREEIVGVLVSRQPYPDYHKQ